MAFFRSRQRALRTGMRFTEFIKNRKMRLQNRRVMTSALHIDGALDYPPSLPMLHAHLI